MWSFKKKADTPSLSPAQNFVSEPAGVPLQQQQHQPLSPVSGGVQPQPVAGTSLSQSTPSLSTAQQYPPLPAYMVQQQQNSMFQQQLPPPPQQPLPVPIITTTDTAYPATRRLENGILQVRIIGAKNLKLPDNAAPFITLPYAVIEFDRNEFAAEATGGDPINPVWSQNSRFDVSREADLVVSLYYRCQQDPVQLQSTMYSASIRKQRLAQQSSYLNLSASPTQNIVFLGGVRITPGFENQRPEGGWYPISTSFSAAATGEINVQFVYSVLGPKRSMSIDDFDLLKVIGKGSFGKVMQVRKKDTGRIYAMKIIRKASIIERSEVEHTLAERNVLAIIRNPFIVNLKYSFQSPDKLYLALAFVNGGELFYHLQTEGCFREERAKFYAAELLIALECLHQYNIIYRDLKPENILLDYTGHIALCDFGLCKLNMAKDDKTNTFCGTPEYLAPELLIGKGYTKVVDWWTLGVLLYEMLYGLPPFYSENTNEMYRKILNDPLRIPNLEAEGIYVSPEAQHILTRLLDRDPNQRLGANGAEEIRQHPFFCNIDWARLYRRQIIPPFRPQVASATDTSNFSEEFTSEVPTDSYVEGAPALSRSVQDQFQGFTYIGNENNAMYGASVQRGGPMSGTASGSGGASGAFQHRGPIG